MENTAPPKEKILVALDVPTYAGAQVLLNELEGLPLGCKVGLQLFTREGPIVVQELVSDKRTVFLDLKFHDIPNTVREAVRSAAALGVKFASVHLSGGPDMLRAAVEGAEGSGLTLLGITVLTSASEATLRAAGIDASVEDQVKRLGDLAADCGIPGIVASPREAAALRASHGESFTIVTPGIRPAGAAVNDQQRISTPAEALAAGADWLVIGRPIAAAKNPREAAAAILEEMENADAARA